MNELKEALIVRRHKIEKLESDLKKINDEYEEYKIDEDAEDVEQSNDMNKLRKGLRTRRHKIEELEKKLNDLKFQHEKYKIDEDEEDIEQIKDLESCKKVVRTKKHKLEALEEKYKLETTMLKTKSDLLQKQIDKLLDESKKKLSNYQQIAIKLQKYQDEIKQMEVKNNKHIENLNVCLDKSDKLSEEHHREIKTLNTKYKLEESEIHNRVKNKLTDEAKEDLKKHEEKIQEKLEKMDEVIGEFDKLDFSKKLNIIAIELEKKEEEINEQKKQIAHLTTENNMLLTSDVNDYIQKIENLEETINELEESKKKYEKNEKQVNTFNGGNSLAYKKIKKIKENYNKNIIKLGTEYYKTKHLRYKIKYIFN
tara:strand:+ start:1612 stop:2712 length:1101 start_codon:yes stop_codon:yes gene_type:complete